MSEPESTEAISQEKLAERGNLTSDEYRHAFTCGKCRTTWYCNQMDFYPSYCPNCGSQRVKESELPGAILLNPGVEWPEDDPFVGGDED